jgi:hypothetical protein
MSTHPKALSNEGITPERYKELRAVCHQYPEYRRILERERRGLTEKPMGRPSAWRRSDPTGNRAVAIAASRCARRVALIEQTANAAAGAAIAPALIESVSTERGYDALKTRPPCGRRMFYVLRLAFYILLDTRLDEQD